MLMKKLMIYLKGSRLQCVLAPLFKMLEAILELFVPLVMANIIDVGIGNSDKNYILKIAVTKHENIFCCHSNITF